ncbi:hypothetical protein [Streptomyces sp. NPDC051997]|uniref:hypothetical protein n=1 Tax=Streptomyces sp. NPDC051997 TaxID=3155611 RepID=UPI003443F4AB
MRTPFISRDRHEQALAAEKATAEHLERRLKTAQNDLAAAHKQLAAGHPVEDHDGRAKALADALGAMDPGLTWDQLIARAAELKDSAGQWMAEASTERTRANGLQSVIDATRARRTQAPDEDSRPVDAGSTAPRSLASELLREKSRANTLAARLAEVTAANQACVCGGGER